MKRGVLVLLLLGFLIGNASSSHAKVAAGESCAKPRQERIVNGLKFTCLKLGSKLLWSNGVKVSQRSSSSGQPNSTALEVLPRGSRTYFGLSPNSFESDCWLARQFTNSSNSTSVRAWQVTELVSDRGTVIASVAWLVPSLAPKTSVWLARETPNIDCRSQGPSRTIDKPIEKDRVIRPIGSETVHWTTPVSDRPQVLQVIVEAGKVSGTSTYSLQVNNVSKDKYLAGGSVISIVFLNGGGEPIFAANGRTKSDVPPSTVAVLSTYDFEIGAFALPNGTESIVGGLTHRLRLGANSSWY